MPMDHALFTTLIALGLLAFDLAAIAVLVWRSQGVERTLAWLFAILAFPGAGALAFFALANPSVRRASRRLHEASALRQDACPRECAPEEPDPLFTLAEKATGFAPTAGNEVTLMAENAQAFRRIKEAIVSAERFIWAEYYIIKRDETGGLFLDLLARRAAEGLEVRLLYDALGSLDVDEERLSAIRAAGGKVAAFHPLNPLRRRWAVHLRNHRKLVAIDGETGFTGGMNVGDEYSGRSRRKGGLFFHDTHMMLKGPAAADLAEVFALDWAFATGSILALPRQPAGPGPGKVEAAVVPSGPDQERNATALCYFGALGQAKKRAFITSPYFIPNEPMLFAIQCAAMRGVDVRVLVPAKCDVSLVGPAARSYFPVLLRAGVRVYEYLPSMLHAKTMVVDGLWCLVGSANLDIRSFRLNFELGALVRDRDFGGLLEERFLSDIKKSRELSLAALASRSIFTKAWERTSRLLSPLL